MTGIIILISLWLNPIISSVIFRLTKNKTGLSEKAIKAFLLLDLIVITALIIGISTISIPVDLFVIGLLHLSICFFLWVGYFKKEKVIRIISIILMVAVFGVGYLLSTVGILGVLMVSAEYEPSKSIRINNTTVYKEYGVGNATTSWGGLRICLFRNLSWFPFFERQFFEKEYLGGLGANMENKISPKDSFVNSKASFHSNEFTIKYDSLRQELVLSNEDKKDTLHLETSR